MFLLELLDCDVVAYVEIVGGACAINGWSSEIFRNNKFVRGPVERHCRR
jgi:hypothetical protein